MMRPRCVTTIPSAMECLLDKNNYCIKKIAATSVAPTHTHIYIFLYIYIFIIHSWAYWWANDGSVSTKGINMKWTMPSCVLDLWFLKVKETMFSFPGWHSDPGSPTIPDPKVTFLKPFGVLSPCDSKRVCGLYILYCFWYLTVVGASLVEAHPLWPSNSKRHCRHKVCTVLKCM